MTKTKTSSPYKSITSQQHLRDAAALTHLTPPLRVVIPDEIDEYIRFILEGVVDRPEAVIARIKKQLPRQHEPDPDADTKHPRCPQCKLPQHFGSVGKKWHGRIEFSYVEVDGELILTQAWLAD